MQLFQVNVKKNHLIQSAYGGGGGYPQKPELIFYQVLNSCFNAIKFSSLSLEPTKA